MGDNVLGYYVQINNQTTKKYETLDEKAFKNFLDFASGLKFQKMNYVGADFCKETYFDTPAHLLTKAGVILSRFEEGKNVFFKVETSASLSKMLNKLKKGVFVHKVGHTDKISDHAFYIKDGITSLYSNQFSIDLENIINSSVPTIEVAIQAQIYELISGTGMRTRIALENKTAKNFETKRKYKVQSITIKLESNPEVYLKEFENLDSLISKNCKTIMSINESQFDWAFKVTKPIVIIPKEKQKKQEDKF